jgi:hypothetical protein
VAARKVVHCEIEHGDALCQNNTRAMFMFTTVAQPLANAICEACTRL